jgi:uncharacterized protein (TIGR02594 family)
MLPKSYGWLREEAAPKVLLEALKLYGVTETPGAKDNPIILEWAKDVGLEKVYRKDETPWCGLFVAVVAKRAGYEPVKDPLWALNWQKFGNKADKASLGDILVFKRKVATGWAGHVGIYVGETPTHYAVLGGNQADMVCISSIPKSRCVAVRRSPWRIGQPDNVRPIRLSAAGVPTTTEA